MGGERETSRRQGRYEAARLAYATLIEKYGTRDELLFRMLRYFIRTDNAQEVERLRVYFASRPEASVDPAVYAELGGYLVDHRQLDYAQDVLFKADEAKPDLAEIHYNLARYYRLAQRARDEKLALDATVQLLRPTDPLTPKRLTMEIDTHTRLGESTIARDEYIDGEKELQEAIATVEENQKIRLIGTGQLFGRPYADLGDLHYYIEGTSTRPDALPEGHRQLVLRPRAGLQDRVHPVRGGDYAAALASFCQDRRRSGDCLPGPGCDLLPSCPRRSGPVDYPGKAPANLLYAWATPSTRGATSSPRRATTCASGIAWRRKERLSARFSRRRSPSTARCWRRS